MSAKNCAHVPDNVKTERKAVMTQSKLSLIPIKDRVHFLQSDHLLFIVINSISDI